MSQDGRARVRSTVAFLGLVVFIVLVVWFLAGCA
jgi:hypothetical protein